jgi:hypothetical protein
MAPELPTKKIIPKVIAAINGKPKRPPTAPVEDNESVTTPARIQAHVQDAIIDEAARILKKSRPVAIAKILGVIGALGGGYGVMDARLPTKEERQAEIKAAVQEATKPLEVRQMKTEMEIAVERALREARSGK